MRNAKFDQAGSMRAWNVCRTVRRDKHRTVTTNPATNPETFQIVFEFTLCVRGVLHADTPWQLSFATLPRQLWCAELNSERFVPDTVALMFAVLTGGSVAEYTETITMSLEFRNGNVAHFPWPQSVVDKNVAELVSRFRSARRRTSLTFAGVVRDAVRDVVVGMESVLCVEFVVLTLFTGSVCPVEVCMLLAVVCLPVTFSTCSNFAIVAVQPSLVMSDNMSWVCAARSVINLVTRPGSVATRIVWSCLASDANVVYRWFPSERNPADEPSRRFEWSGLSRRCLSLDEPDPSSADSHAVQRVETEKNLRDLLGPAAAEAAQEQQRAANRAVKAYALPPGFTLGERWRSAPSPTTSKPRFSQPSQTSMHPLRR